MKWNQDIFIKNIERLLNKKFDGVQSRLNEVIGGRDAVTRWKRGERPALSVLLKVTDVFGCTLNDLVMEETEVAKDEQAGAPPGGVPGNSTPWEFKMLFEGQSARIEAQARTIEALYTQIAKLQEKNTTYMEVIAEFRQTFTNINASLVNINAAIDKANYSANQNKERIIQLQAQLLEAANKKSWEPILLGERRKTAE